MAVQRALFKVIGMYCTTCKPIVEKQLKGEQAIKRIDIDFMTDSVIVEYDSSIITRANKRKARELGLQVLLSSQCYVVSAV